MYFAKVDIGNMSKMNVLLKKKDSKEDIYLFLHISTVHHFYTVKKSPTKHFAASAAIWSAKR